MERDELVRKLRALVKVDMDAVRAYDRAIEETDVPAVKKRFQSYRDDHQRHIRELSEVIRESGGEIPDMKQGIRGFLVRGFTDIRSRSGTYGALRAMRSNEKYTNIKYEDAAEWETGPLLKEIMFRNLDDERRHLNYIEQEIRAESVKV